MATWRNDLTENWNFMALHHLSNGSKNIIRFLRTHCPQRKCLDSNRLAFVPRTNSPDYYAVCCKQDNKKETNRTHRHAWHSKYIPMWRRVLIFVLSIQSDRIEWIHFKFKSMTYWVQKLSVQIEITDIYEKSSENKRSCASSFGKDSYIYILFSCQMRKQIFFFFFSVYKRFFKLFLIISIEIRQKKKKKRKANKKHIVALLRKNNGFAATWIKKQRTLNENK